jgi:hypothetical protein
MRERRGRRHTPPWLRLLLCSNHISGNPKIAEKGLKRRQQLRWNFGSHTTNKFRKFITDGIAKQ